MKNKLALKPVTNIWCGFALTDIEKDILTELTLLQFEKPVSMRISVSELIKIVKIKVGL